jgi:hypothetical protein
MYFDQVTNDCQSQSEASVRPGARSIGLTEAVKYSWQKVTLDPFAGITHCDQCMRTGAVQLDLHRAVSGSELHGIRQKIPDDLSQAIDVAVDESTSGLQHQLEPYCLCLSRRSDALERCFNNRLQLAAPEVKWQLPGNDARHFEQIINQLGLEPGVAGDGFNGFELLIGRLPSGASVTREKGLKETHPLVDWRIRLPAALLSLWPGPDDVR